MKRAPAPLSEIDVTLLLIINYRTRSQLPGLSPVSRQAKGQGHADGERGFVSWLRKYINRESFPCILTRIFEQ